MKRERFVVKLSDHPGEPFLSAEEAWLWFSRCQLARLNGERFSAGHGTARPCDPDDVYRAVDGLYRRRLLLKRHMEVLARFGTRLAPPDPWQGDEREQASLWDEAMDVLSPVLKTKGIVA